MKEIWVRIVSYFKKTFLYVYIVKPTRRVIEKLLWSIVVYMPTIAVLYIYRFIFGKFPDLRNPETINEKLQVLKLGKYYNNDRVTECVDKYKVKEWLINDCKIKDLKFAAVYAAFDSVETFMSFDFKKLPDKFVVKCNHGCGYNYICLNKNVLDLEDLFLKMKTYFNEEFWKLYAEYQYRFIKKKIFIEEYIEPIDHTYKLYCFDGKAKFLYISNSDSEGNVDVYLDYFDINFNHLPISLDGHLHCQEKIQKPLCWERIIEISEILAKEFPFVRVDLYESNNEIYFSEMTFFPTGGYMKLLPAGTDLEWGKYLKV